MASYWMCSENWCKDRWHQFCNATTSID